MQMKFHESVKAWIDVEKLNVCDDPESPLRFRLLDDEPPSWEFEAKTESEKKLWVDSFQKAHESRFT